MNTKRIFVGIMFAGMLFSLYGCNKEGIFSPELPEGKLSIDHIQVAAVNPPTGELSAGDQVAINYPLQYQAIVYYRDGSYKDMTDDVNWISDNMAVASIDSEGVALGLSADSTFIYAELSGVDSNKSPLTITGATALAMTIDGRSATLLDLPVDYQAIASFNDGTSQNLTQFADWNSSLTSVATASNETVGQIIPTGHGTTDITASYDLGGVVSDPKSLTVLTRADLDADSPYNFILSPNTATIAQGTSETYTVQFQINLSDTAPIDAIPPFNITNYMEFGASDESIVEFERTSNSDGKGAIRAKGLKTGVVDVRASIDFDGSTHSRTGILTVMPATISDITVTCDNSSIPAGTDTQCYAKATYYSEADIDIGELDDDVTEDVSWSSTADIATVNSYGWVTGVTQGNAEVSASTIDDIKGTTIVEVTDSIVTSISITNEEDFVYSMLPMRAFGTTTSSSESMIDITKRVVWDSDGGTIDTSGLLIADDLDSDTTIVVTASAGTDVSSDSKNLLVCGTLNGACIDVVDITNDDATGLLFTSPPSLPFFSEYSEYMTEVEGYGIRGENVPDSGTVDWVLLSWYQMDAYCSGLNDILKFRNNWKVPSLEQLQTFGDYVEDVKAKYSWPSNEWYRSSTYHSGWGNNGWTVDLGDNSTHDSALSETQYITCVSEP